MFVINQSSTFADVTLLQCDVSASRMFKWNLIKDRKFIYVKIGLLTVSSHKSTTAQTELGTTSGYNVNYSTK